MSADNGIYILETIGPEFRVKHLMAVENVYWNDILRRSVYTDYDNAIQNAREMWKDCVIYKVKSDAMDAAGKMEEEIYSSDFPVLEYGISFIRIPKRF